MAYRDPLLGAVPPLLLLLLSASCGYEEAYTGLGRGALPGDPLRPEPVVTNCPAAPACICNCTCSGTPETPVVWTPFRMNELLFVKPAALAMINELVKNAVSSETGYMHLLLALNLDQLQEGDQVDGWFGAATQEGDAFRPPAQPNELRLQFVGDLFATVAPVDLQLAITLAAGTDPLMIPLKHLTFQGKLVEENLIQDGRLTGILLVADAKQVMLFNNTLDQLLKMAGANPDQDTDEDGENDAWQMEIECQAERVRLVGADEDAGEGEGEGEGAGTGEGEGA